MSITRRELLGMLGAASLPLPRLDGFTWEEAQDDITLPTPKRPAYRKPNRPVTAIVLGYGGRGGYYGYMESQMPDDWKIVGVAEPIDYRREQAISRHKLGPEVVFDTWEKVFDKPKFADVIVVSTPDNLHIGPALAALNKGYHLLLEKPIAQSWRQCRDILFAAEKAKAYTAVCHVLRYAPYFVQMEAVLRSGLIGDVVSIQHLEPIHYRHFAHSYVRGPWHNEKDSNPSLLAKSCHDLDLIKWFAGVPCRRVSSFGGLTHFSKKYAPEGAPTHCSKGCPIVETCPYEASNFYVKKKLWSTHHIISRDRSDEAILRAMKETQYDACVYRHRNDVCDHQTVMMEFDGNITANFNMEANSSYGGRRTRIFCTGGDIVGDERFLDVYNFQTGKAVRWDVAQHNQGLDGHGGGDQRMVRDLCQAIAWDDSAFLLTDLQESMESHHIGFQSEVSRHKGGQVQKVDIKSAVKR
ncbi:MAG: Gfo/Idh/MocA family oxidoreductase [Fimbriimonadaceae bacterium]|nr:Gfo/Idh/MocA family oxidoreductase [Fimbriimonadaceae bacterium]